MIPDGASAFESRNLAFRDRAPSDSEFERLRLTLSTYTDGSGHFHKDGRTYPDWRDWERVIASSTNGIAVESKSIVDVEVPIVGSRPFGLSCKSRVSRLSDEHVLMELSNSAAYFRTYLLELGLWPIVDARLAGPALVALVQRWHDEARGRLDVANSSYLHLAHTPNWQYWRVSWFPMSIIQSPPPESLDWQHHLSARVAGSSRTIGLHNGRMLWEWYGDSGGQLKFYPLLENARWISPWFYLETPPEDPDPRGRAERYWPHLWPGDV
jgi:hypothetical protein